MSGQTVVIFTPYDEFGVIDPPNAISIEANFVYGGNKYSHERYNQVSKRTLDGVLHTEDSGIEIETSQLKMESVSDDDGYAFRTWIRTILFYRLRKFRAEPQDLLLDIGNGRGATVDNCNYLKTDTKGVFTPNPPDNFTIVFPFDFLAV